MKKAAFIIFHNYLLVSRPSQSYQFMFGVGEVCFFEAVVVGCPAVRHQEVEDWRVVGDLWTSPADHQSAAVDMLDLHVGGSTAADCRRVGGRREMNRG